MDNLIKAATLANIIFISTPALAHVATRLITREGWGRLWLWPNFRRGWRFYLADWLLPLLAVTVGGAIFYLLFPQSFDPNLGELRKLGAIFPERPEELYWLTQEEVAVTCEKLDRCLPVDRISRVIPERKAALRAAQKATPPLKLPHLTLPGLQNRFTSLSRGRERSSLKGVAASAGCVTARACVLHGPEDFDQMTAGAVLVAELTTPAWTPLFARAVAIVTDVGGPLSHGSIVAREYGIPAVLGTGVATKHISTGQVITVDGSKGVVFLGKN